MFRCQGGGRRLRQHEGWRTGGHAAAESNAMHHALLCSFGLQMRWAVWMDDWGVGCEAEEDGREGGMDARRKQGGWQAALANGRAAAVFSGCCRCWLLLLIDVLINQSISQPVNQ